MRPLHVLAAVAACALTGIGTTAAGALPTPAAKGCFALARSCASTAETARVPANPAPRVGSTRRAATTGVGPNQAVGAAAVGAAGRGRWQERFGVSEPVDVLLTHPDRRDQLLDDYVALGVGWLRTDFAWPYLESNGPQSGWALALYDELVEAASRRGIKILAVLDYSPSWAAAGMFKPPRDLRSDGSPSFNAFCRWVVARYKRSIDHWEIWNEPNGGYFLQSAAPARDYARLLRGAYRAIKVADPSSTVLGGALVDPVRYGAASFLEDMYAHGARGHFDALSHHPYLAVQGNSANAVEGGPWSVMYYGRRSLRSIMAAHGDRAKKIWATEYGYATGDAGNGEAEIQRNMRIDAQNWKSYPWGGALFWFSNHEDGQGFGLSGGGYPLEHKPRWHTWRDVVGRR